MAPSLSSRANVHGFVLFLWAVSPPTAGGTGGEREAAVAAEGARRDLTPGGAWRRLYSLRSTSVMTRSPSFAFEAHRRRFHRPCGRLRRSLRGSGRGSRRAGASPRRSWSGSQFRAGGFVRRSSGMISLPALLVAPRAQPEDERLGHVLDDREAARHIAVERGVAGRHLALVAGRERHRAELVRERHEHVAALARLQVLLGGTRFGAFEGSASISSMAACAGSIGTVM